MNVASRSISTSISNLAGRRLLTKLPPALASYSPDEWAGSSWPAIERYKNLLTKNPAVDADRLRLMRHEAWLRCALATATEAAPARDVCYFWTKRAEELIAEAWRASGCEAHGYALLALGKLGAEELNLSSDVDLIAVRSDDAPIDLKAFRIFQSLLADSTDFGFCLRVDFTLRPGGKAASALPSLSEFEYHYGYQGEMWERLAYVRMRILSAPDGLANSIREFTRKFSFRKHLDYTLLDELKSLRAKIRQEKFESRPNAYHLKLGQGGIRELELFVHALQVIHAGRYPSMRTHSTSEALEKIKEFGLLPSTECSELLEAYWYLRTLENRLHAYEDQQNYLVDTKLGHPALPKDFAPKLAATTARVCAIADTFFNQGDVNKELLADDIGDQRTWLTELGFAKHSLEDTWPELLAATALGRRSKDDEDVRLAFLKGFVTTLSTSGLDRDLGLSLLLDFVKSIRAKASFFTLLNRETRIRDNLARLFSISPYLGSILASRPELIDEFIFRRQAEPSQDLDVLLEELTDRRLLSELIGSNQFLSDSDLRKLSLNLSENADTICTTLLNRLVEEYGPSPIGLIAMGKWGGRELGLKSDLDFVFVVPDEPTANDQKIARRFLSRITEPHRGGAIYAVDLRLRPSGSSGPILVSAKHLKSYLERTVTEGANAAAWERQAYLRARPLLNLGFHPAQAAASQGLSQSDDEELRMIRSKLFTSGKPGELDLKLTDGGLADIEFTAQIALLARGEFSLDPSTSGMIQYLESVDASWMSVGESLRGHYEFLRRVEQLFQLTTSQSGSKIRLKSDEFRRLALVMNSSPEELEQEIRKVFASVVRQLEFARR